MDRVAITVRLSKLIGDYASATASYEQALMNHDTGGLVELRELSSQQRTEITDLLDQLAAGEDLDRERPAPADSLRVDRT